MRCQNRHPKEDREKAGPKCQLLKGHEGLHANGIVYIEGRAAPSPSAVIWD